ncbi:MAG TPA: hypothetical protein VGQ59_17690 [Cyclobacteriaceae bacterium]|jgi:hypothetical protein|nr:hypothetical protein [Cyclobacteriaceae bacterium]
MEHTLFESQVPGAWIRLRFFTETDLIIFEGARKPNEEEMITIVNCIKESKASRMVYHIPSVIEDSYSKIRELLGGQIEYGAYALNQVLHDKFQETIFHRLTREQDPVKSFYSAIQSVYPNPTENIELTEEEIDELDLLQSEKVLVDEEPY